MLENKITGFCTSLNKRWISSKRTLNEFTKKNEGWLNLNFNISLSLSTNASSSSSSSTCIPSSSKCNVGRPTKPFIYCSNKTKKRKIKNLLVENSKEKLIHAAKTVLYSDGNHAGADILKQITECSPKRAVSIRKMYKNRNKSVSSSYTADEALSLIIDAKLTKNSYLILKKGSKLRNADIYPSYDQIKMAKNKCYPNNIKVNEYSVSVPLTELVNHTKIIEISS